MIPVSSSRNKRIIASIFTLALIGGSFYLIKIGTPRIPEGTACTMEAKICSDGSSVGRIGPACEFAECPTETGEADYGDDQIERSFADLLVAQDIFARHTQEDSRNFCIVENLDPEQEPFPFHAWARCGEFTYRDGEVEEVSGVSEPVKIDYPDSSISDGSPYGVEKFTFEVPESGSAYAVDIDRIFPENIRQAISEYDDTAISQRLATQALAKLRSEFDIDTTWDMIKAEIADCAVEKVFQSHDLSVSASLTNGQVLKSTEPQIDDIIDLARAAETECGKIIMATE